MPEPFLPDRLALLAAIHADPRSDLPRLVYADWLDDHGEAPHAEFVRLQCRCPEDVAFRPKSGSWEIKTGLESDPAIAGRMLELARRHGDEWYRPYPRNRATDPYIFRRGLPTVVCRFEPSHAVRDAKAAARLVRETHQLTLLLVITKHWLGPINWDHPIFRRAARLVVAAESWGRPCHLSGSAVTRLAGVGLLSRFTAVLFEYPFDAPATGLPDNFVMWDDGRLRNCSILPVLGNV